jgi:hypothetical protein
MIFWEGWLLKASDGSNKWKARYFRVRDNKLEYLEVGEDDELGRRAGMEDNGLERSGQFSSKFGDFLSNVVSSARDAVRDEPRKENSFKKRGSEEDKAGGASTGINSDKNLEVAKEVGEAPRGWINLEEDVAGYFVFGSTNGLLPELKRQVDLSSALHDAYHSGPPNLLIVGKTGKPSWRLGLGQSAPEQVDKLFTTIGPSMCRGTVLASGWVNTPGTINWNRRYAMLLSTGNLLIFKDASLDNLRRDFCLRDAGCVVEPLRPLQTVGSPGDEALFESLARSKQQAYNETVTIRVVHPSNSDKKGYLMSIERSREQESPSVHYGRFREWLRLLQAGMECKAAATTAPISLDSFTARARTLRNSYESHLVLGQMIADGAFVPSPCMVTLSRVGFPAGALRSKLWQGFAARAVRAQRRVGPQEPHTLACAAAFRFPSLQQW